MISQKNKELAEWAMRFALKQGCSDARVSVYSGTYNSFDYRDTQLDKLEQSSENGLSIHLYVDGKFGAYATNRLDKTELERFISNGIEATRYLAKDEFRQLPDPVRYYRGDGKGLNTYDAGHETVSVDEKMALIKNTTAEVYGKDERVISVSASYNDGVNSSFVITSNGFEGELDTTTFGLSAETAMKGQDDSRPSSYWYDSAVFWEKLRKTGIGTTAYERTVRKLGQEKIASGVFPMLVDNTQSRQLLSPLIAALNGNAIQQKNSFLMDKLNECIVSDQLTLIDDPHIVGAQGSRWFDGEGVATKRMTVIDKGVLKTYYIDTYSGLKMNMTPTIQGPSILTCKLGDKNFDRLLETIKKGIWVTGFNGGNSNSTTGDFSFGVEGFLIENGKAVKPVNEMNITGNLLVLWKNIIEIGNDPFLISSWRIPSIVFDAVNFSGK